LLGSITGNHHTPFLVRSGVGIGISFEEQPKAIKLILKCNPTGKGKDHGLPLPDPVWTAKVVVLLYAKLSDVGRGHDRNVKSVAERDVSERSLRGRGVLHNSVGRRLWAGRHFRDTGRRLLRGIGR
jgi:hypothetical protein